MPDWLVNLAYIAFGLVLVVFILGLLAALTVCVWVTVRQWMKERKNGNG